MKIAIACDHRGYTVKQRIVAQVMDRGHEVLDYGTDNPKPCDYPDFIRPAAQAVARRCRVRGSPALLIGRLFDDRGNRMSPSHTNKRGVRYRYYVSQAVLQNKPLAKITSIRVEYLAIELDSRLIFDEFALRKALWAGSSKMSLVYHICS